MLLGSLAGTLLGWLMGFLSLFLILLVLIQRGRGGGLTGALGGPGGQSAFGSKAGDTFTLITVVVATVWGFSCAFTMWLLGTHAPSGAFDNTRITAGPSDEASGTSQTILPSLGGDDTDAASSGDLVPAEPRATSDAVAPADEEAAAPAEGASAPATAPADSAETPSEPAAETSESAETSP